MAINENGQLYFTFEDMKNSGISAIEAYQIMGEEHSNVYDVFIKNIESFGLDLSNFTMEFYLKSKSLYCVVFENEQIYDVCFLGDVDYEQKNSI